MNQTLTYDLSFVSPLRRPRKAPEVVFTIEERHLEEVIDRIHKIKDRFLGYANDYLGGDDFDFSLPIPDLFGNKEFGYRDCGYWTIEDGSVHFRLPLRPFPWTHYNSLTIFILTKALGFPFEVEPGSNRVQDAALMVIAERDRSAGYCHAVGGWISEDVLNWLKSYAQANIQPIGIISNAAPMHPEVIRAQQAAAGAMISSKKYGYRASSRQIYGWIRDSGAFSMNCYGNACDLSVYPDRYLGEGCESVELGCHNLDNADQQLTLLAGLAKICQLARESS